jgi:hypothetical protein
MTQPQQFTRDDIPRLAGLFTQRRFAILLRLRTSRDFVSRKG